uniref:DLEC1 cilia and flagella associated protein n=1 Tax=Anas platyrhynchos TaxID=8839 RepID=A0A8B9SFV6_ANAPL
ASSGSWGSFRKRKGFALSVNRLISFPQDISPLLASTFKDLYTGDVIGSDIVANWIKSRGGEDVYHEAFTEELQKLVAEYNCRLTEADRVEENIIQAQARARAEEERALNVLKVDAGEEFHKMGLPPVASSFRWIVDNELLRKNHLTCPDDYITDKLPVTRAPKGKTEPGYMKETFSFKQRISSDLQDQMTTQIAHLQKISGSLSNVSLSTLTLLSTPDSSHQTKKASSKCKAEGERECAYLAKLERRQNYLKNPRFFPPNTLHGGKSLVISQEKMEKIIAEAYTQIALARPFVFFYQLDRRQHMVRVYRHLSRWSYDHKYLCQLCEVSIFNYLHFFFQGKFPGKGGMIAPGMSCQYVVQFIPEYLADYEDYILVETQVSEPLQIQIQAKRPAPVLTLPCVIDCGSCLVGGIKVTPILCRNEGFSTGKFCIMPKKAWPPPNFMAVATAGFVTQDPFGIYPAVFELAPGQSTTVEVMFFPSSPEVSQQIYTIVCDNCQVNDVTVTGVGQLIALELLHVTGGESSPAPGEVTDVTAQHLIRFDPQNPHTTEEKNLVIRNSTHVELPFYWQIIKPNLQPSVPEEAADSTKIEYKRDTESAFSLNPEQGVLLPHADHEFTLTYAPQELKTYHSVIQMVLRDIPESPSLVKEGMLQNIPQYKAEDVIALEIEVKGSTEPFQLLLEPYAIIIPGESFISVNVRKTFKMWNNSKSLIKYTWEKITACDIVEVEPHTGVIDMNECCEFELTITGGKPGHVSHNLLCKIEHSPEPVVLHVEAAFKGPLLCIDVPSLQLGLIKWGESVLRTFEIKNLCQLPARWRMQESQVCLAERNEEVSPFTIQPSAGEIPPLGSCCVSVQFTSVLCQRLQTILELEVENGEGSHLPVFVEVQTPQACLMSSHLALTEIYTGIPVKATSKLFNQTQLPAKYLWGKLVGSQAAFCSATVSPASGTLGPNEEKEFYEMLAFSSQNRTDILILTFFSDSDGRQILQSPCDLLLDFGSEVTFKDIVKRQLIITNHTAISAPFKLEAEYFTGYSPIPEEICLSSGHLVKRRGPITKHAAKRAQSGMRNNSLLSHGKGVAFHVQPSSGTLKAFQQLIIEITAYNNMWGEYHDDLVCKVGGQVSPLRFGTHVSGGCPVLRSVRLNNPTPFDIRLDWETYNQVKDDKKLVDLLMFFGDPFPPKDVDENETASTGSNSELEISSGTDSKEIAQEPAMQKIVSVLIRPHEGVPANNPYSVTPRQIVVPGGGSISVCISFTPHVLPETVTEVQCEGFALGFMSLDGKVNWYPSRAKDDWEIIVSIPVISRAGCCVLDMDHDGEMMFYSMASDLIPDQPLLGVLTDSVMTQSLKLINCTKVPLYFRLLLSTPFSLASTDLQKNTKTSHSKKEETEQQPQLVLYPQQNMLVKVSFHTTLELLTYQHLPDTQMLPGFQVLQFENGERKLKFSQNLVIEYSNHSTQLVPVTAHLTVPVLELSCDTVDFKTCFVAQTKTEHVFLSNRSGCRSYWTALLGIWVLQLVFSVSPPNGILEAREGDQPTKDVLQITFTARKAIEYEAVVTISGMLGEKPCTLHIRGCGSYDGKYEDPHLI